MICKCGWKHSEEVCPRCGRNGGSRRGQAEAMREFVKRQPMRCSHCGLPIKVWKWGNVDHIKPKSTHPELVADPENMRVLCDDLDIMYSDRVPAGELSCHAIRHRGTNEQWEHKRSKYDD